MTTETGPEAIDGLWEYGDPAGSEARFRSVLAQMAPGSEAQVEAMTQIARAQGLQRQFAAAHQTLDRAEALLRPDMRRARVRCLLERGRVFNSARERARAAPLFLAAWEAAVAAEEDFYAIDAAHMLGICEPPERQVEWDLKALDLAERSGQPRARGWLGALCNNLGWTFHDRGDYARALDLFEKGLRWREEQGQAEETRIARWSVARALRSLGRIDEALEQQRALLAEHERAGSQDGYVHEELAECLLLLDRMGEAQPHFARAYQLLSADPWLVEAEPERLERLRALGAPPA
jgi:tetratricopeptide (TPR) repeat protein